MQDHAGKHQDWSEGRGSQKEIGARASIVVLQDEMNES